VTPGQTPQLAIGFCQEAAHDGFHNFHDIVHTLVRPHLA
jgi:hypothetical protein